MGQGGPGAGGSGTTDDDRRTNDHDQGTTDDEPGTADTDPESGGDDGGSRSRDSGNADADQVSTAEKVVMVTSAAFTVALFGVALWYALTGPGVVAPTVGVVDSQQSPDGDVVYTVELRNPGDVGLVTATVSAECTDPPTSLTFENVPATAHRTGTIVCPSGTTDPSMSVSTWIPE